MIRRFALALFTLGAAACGGNDEKPRPPDPGACRPIVPLVDYPDPWGGRVDCGALDGYEVLLFDQFEPFFTDQAWYVNNDRTAEQEPPADTNAPPFMTEIPGGRCMGVPPAAGASCTVETLPRGECDSDLVLESRGAMHIVTGNLTNSGGQLGRNLSFCQAGASECPLLPGAPEYGACSVADAPTPGVLGCTGFNASDWDGIVLWARVGPGSQTSVKVRVADRRTDDKGCICNPYTNQNDSSDGCDKWGRFINLDQTFRVYLVPFTDLQQGGWGAASPGLDTGDLFSLAVEYGRGAWDLWLDDIGFYRRKQ